MPLTLRGRVVDARTRKPLADAIVFVNVPGGATTDTKADGSFAIPDQPSGWTFELAFRKEGYHPTTIGGVSGADREFAMEPVAKNAAEACGARCRCPAGKPCHKPKGHAPPCDTGHHH